MCKVGNQTIYAACAAKLLRQGIRTNAEMRQILKNHGGCLVPKLDTEKVAVVK